jgi:hypothetical protein
MGTLALLGLLWCSSPAFADLEDSLAFTRTGPLSDLEKDALALAEKIDQHMAAGYKDKMAEPAPLSGDNEFLRRASLDLNGHIPSLVLARDFPQMSDADKRRDLLRLLIKDPRFAQHFAVVWRNILLPPPGNTPFGQDPNFYANFERWLREELGAPQARFDQIAKPLVLGTGTGRNPSGQTFYQVNEFKPENLAGVTSRLFLGFKLECAQCHDHPFDKWTRKQFWEYAAFFGGVNRRTPNGAGGREITIPGLGKKVQARFPDGTEPKFSDGVDSRAVLFEWMSSPQNPYFAKATVNRMWEYFFGVGLVDPLDEPSEDNPASHPELFDELAKEFAAHQYDLRFLALAITASKTYQRSSAFTDPTQKDPHVFARAVVRGLTAEQVLDSMSRAASQGDNALGTRINNGVDQFGRPNRTLRGEFLDRFPLQVKKSEAATSILQALFMMNSEATEVMISAKEGGNLDWLMKDSKKVTNAKRVEQLFLLTLTRLPTADESKRFVAYLDKGGPTGDSRKAISDIFWALLNCSEFALNH